MNKDVIVTGGAGFIGANIVSALQDRGYIETFRTKFPGRSFHMFDE